MFVILIASFMLAIIFALSLKRPERRKKRRTVFVETGEATKKLDEHAPPIDQKKFDPPFATQENVDNQTLKLPTEKRKHKIFVPNSIGESVAKVIIVHD